MESFLKVEELEGDKVLRSFSTANVKGMLITSFEDIGPAVLRKEKTEIYGRDGFIYDSEEAYDQASREVKIFCQDDRALNRALGFFYSGLKGKFFFSDDLKYKEAFNHYEEGLFRYGQIDSIKVSPINYFDRSRYISLVIDLQPFLYEEFSDSFIITNSGAIENKGFYNNNFKIAIKGGNFGSSGRITINGSYMEVYSSSDIVIDNFNMEVFKNGKPANHLRYAGDFFTLKPGHNGISLSSGISEIEIRNYKTRLLL